MTSRVCGQRLEPAWNLTLPPVWVPDVKVRLRCILDFSLPHAPLAALAALHERKLLACDAGIDSLMADGNARNHEFAVFEIVWHPEQMHGEIIEPDCVPSIRCEGLDWFALSLRDRDLPLESRLRHRTLRDKGRFALQGRPASAKDHVNMKILRVRIRQCPCSADGCWRWRSHASERGLALSAQAN